MALVIMSFVLVTVAVLGMAVGVLWGRRPLTTSCGRFNGVASLDTVCAGCGRDGKREPRLPNAAGVEADGGEPCAKRV